jgi:ElaB/YqjD/DUF883 family membrane-anchored ribosome-binding protein
MSSEPVVPIDKNLTASETTRLNRQSEVVGVLPVASDVTVPQPEIAPRAKTRDAAESVGTAVGKAVVRVRELPRRVAEMKERFTVIRGRAREDAASTTEDLRQNARDKVRDARTRAEYLAHEYPLQFIAGAGAAAFVFGFAMRVWRSSRRAY